MKKIRKIQILDLWFFRPQAKALQALSVRRDFALEMTSFKTPTVRETGTVAADIPLPEPVSQALQ